MWNSIFIKHCVFLFLFSSQLINAQLYGVSIWKNSSEKIVYISNPFEYEAGTLSWITALNCSNEIAIKSKVGSKYRDYSSELKLRKSLDPYTIDEAEKLRIKLISEYRAKDYNVYELNIVYDKDACN